MSIELIFIGLFSGTIAGITGLAGGIAIVPFLLIFYGAGAIHDAIVISFYAVFFNSLGTSWQRRESYLQLHEKTAYQLLIKSTQHYTLSALVGAFCIAMFIGYHADEIPKELIASLQLLLCFCMLIPKKWHAFLNIKHSPWLDSIVGSLVGSISAMIGIGGGAYTIVYYYAAGKNMKECTTISNFTGIFIGLMSLCGYYSSLTLNTLTHPLIHHTQIIPRLDAIILITFGFLGSLLGVRIQNKMPSALIKKSIVIFLLITVTHTLLT